MSQYPELKENKVYFVYDSRKTFIGMYIFKRFKEDIAQFAHFFTKEEDYYFNPFYIFVAWDTIIED